MEEKIKDALNTPLEEIGVSIYSVSFEKEDGIDTLFIKLTGEKEIDTDTCAKAAEIINPIIDKLDLNELGENYVLDICSKGETNE